MSFPPPAPAAGAGSGSAGAQDGYRDIRVGGGDTATPRCLGRRVLFFASRLPPKGRILDCGCGAGEYVLRLLEDFHFDAFGVEYEAAKVLRAHAHPRLVDRVSQGDLEALRQPDASFDGALLNEVLEHVPNEPNALREIRRVLKPGATLIVCSPNRWFPFETHGCRFKDSTRGVPVWCPFIPWIPLRWSQRFFTFWARNYWPNEMRALLENAGFKVQEVTFFWPTFENISGGQPWFIRRTRPVLRVLARLLEHTPVLRRLGVSQVFVCR